jgi:FecR protein
MKIARFFGITVVFAFIFSFCANTFAQNHPGYATVVRITGEARFSADNGTTWHPLVVGQTLTAPDVVQTAVNGSLDLVLGAKSAILGSAVANPAVVAPSADSPVAGMSSYKSTAAQNIIHMDSDSVLAIDKLMIGNTGVDAVSDTELDLRQGSIFGNVKKLSASSQYLIKMPNGIAGVRGTTFMLTVNGDITVISGSMVVSFTNGQGQTTTSVLGPGDQYNPFTGQVTQLTPLQLAREEHRLHFTITIEYGIITFVFYNDRTTIVISPDI